MQVEYFKGAEMTDQEARVLGATHRLKADHRHLYKAGTGGPDGYAMVYYNRSWGKVLCSNASLQNKVVFEEIKCT